MLQKHPSPENPEVSQSSSNHLWDGFNNTDYFSSNRRPVDKDHPYTRKDGVSPTTSAYSCHEFKSVSEPKLNKSPFSFPTYKKSDLHLNSPISSQNTKVVDATNAFDFLSNQSRKTSVSPHTRCSHSTDTSLGSLFDFNTVDKTCTEHRPSELLFTPDDILSNTSFFWEENRATSSEVTLETCIPPHWSSIDSFTKINKHSRSSSGIKVSNSATKDQLISILSTNGNTDNPSTLKPTLLSVGLPQLKNQNVGLNGDPKDVNHTAIADNIEDINKLEEYLNNEEDLCEVSNIYDVDNIIKTQADNLESLKLMGTEGKNTKALDTAGTHLNSLPQTVDDVGELPKINQSKHRCKKCFRISKLSYGCANQIVEVLPNLKLFQEYNTRNGYTLDFANQNGDPNYVYLDSEVTTDYDPVVKRYSTKIQYNSRGKKLKRDYPSLCPFCKVTDTKKFDSLFYERNNSCYRGHLINTHGINSTGEYAKLPRSGFVCYKLGKNSWSETYGFECPYQGCNLCFLKGDKTHGFHEYIRHWNRSHID